MVASTVTYFTRNNEVVLLTIVFTFENLYLSIVQFF
jgi:hypothetical protein